MKPFISLSLLLLCTDPLAMAAAEKMPDVGVVPAGKVLASFHETMPAKTRWLNDGEPEPKETTRWHGDAFLLPRLPLRYDEWGIRDGWAVPVLARFSADVALTPGRHRFLVRSHGLSRLWVDGAVIARTKPPSGSTDGHNPVAPVVPPPLPGLRPAGYAQQEIFGEATIAGDGKCRVIFEAIIGGKDARAESGELTVAVQTDDGKSFVLVQPAECAAPPVRLTDEAVTAELASIERSLAALDDAARRTAAASQDTFWKMRHDAARAWIHQYPAPVLPAAADENPVDHFIRAKIERALAAAANSSPEEAKLFHGTVLPVLREQCFRCHGEKEKGGLRLNSREAALKAGKSEKSAVVPGDLAASQLIARIRSGDLDERMPPKGDGLKPAEIATLEAWVKGGAAWPAPPVTPEELAAPSVVGDAAFLRRIFLDTVGVPPTEPKNVIGERGRRGVGGFAAGVSGGGGCGQPERRGSASEGSSPSHLPPSQWRKMWVKSRVQRCSRVHCSAME